MTDSIHQPHDKLIKAVLSDMEEAVAFLRSHLPEALGDLIDWSTLHLTNASYVSEELRNQESDLLYEVQLRDTEQSLFIYVLFEHQSRPQKWMRLRLHKYIGSIWDDSFKKYPDQRELPPILPIVFYQGATTWGYSVEFADLFPEIIRTWSFVPRFAHVLIDQSEMEPTTAAGGLRGQVMQLLMYAAFHKPVEHVMGLAAELLAQLPESSGISYVRVFIHYVFATQERSVVTDFAKTVDLLAAEKGDKIMSYAEELLREGEMKGKIKGKIEGEIKGEIKGKIETIDRFLKVGVAWETIEQATGIDPLRFAELQEELRRLTAGDAALTHSPN